MLLANRPSLTLAVADLPARRQRAIGLVPLLEILCSAVLAGLLFWKGFLPGWRVLNTDFPNYYLVARLLHEGYALDRIYDWVWLQRIKDHWGLDQPLVVFAGLSPFSALPIVPLSWFSALVAKRLWMLVNVLLLVLSVELLRKVTSLGRRRIWLLSLLAVFPMRTSFLYGQMHLLVFVLLVVAYFFHRKKAPAACAVCLSIAGALKIYPLLFGFYFLWKKQWRSALTTLSAAILLLGIGFVWMGRDVIGIYVTQVLPRSLQGEVLDPYSAHAASVAALFHRLFIFEPMLNPVPLLNAPWLYAVLYPLWQLAVVVPLLAVISRQGTRSGTEQLEWATYTVTLLLLSPVPASYHFVVLVFSIVLLIDFLLPRRRYGTVALAAALYCAISMIEVFPQEKGSLLGTFLAFGRLWIELTLWAVFLSCLWQNRASRKASPAVALRTASLYVGVCVAWAAGALAYHRHFEYLQQDISRRMPAAASVYLSNGIHHTFDGYVFTAMVANGYRALDPAGREVWSRPAPVPTDELSVTAAHSVPGLLLELADRNGSRIVITNATQDARLLVAQGESPAISAAGTSVAFIREVKGRGTLWMGRLDQPLGRMRGQPTQIAGDVYDVRDVSFAPSGWIMFAARVDGRMDIFSLIPGSQPKVFLSEEGGVDSPAVSPDERFVAFRKLLHNRWQLSYVDLATGHERVLTSGDCNAYSPEWFDPETIAYATDCGRGLGLSAFATIHIGQEAAYSSIP
jgi:hypothetical protein